MEQSTFAWTALPPLPLRGLDTELVEAFDYYALRMSWTIGWSYRQLSAVLERDGDPLRPSCYLFGARREAQISAMEHFTGNPDLRHGTLWVLKDVINTKGLYREGGATRRWCPRCYESWDPETSWEPLIWSIPCVSRCPVHGCDLVRQCPSCGAEQRRDTPIGPRRDAPIGSQDVSIDRRLHCENCKASLGGKGFAAERPKFHEWVDGQILQLVRFSARPGQEPLARDTLLTFAEEFESYARDKGVAQKVQRCLALQRGESLRRPLSINALINLSALVGAPVVDLLTRPKEALSAPLLDIWSGFRWLYDPFAKKDDTVRSARWLMRKVLSRCNGWYLPAMRAFAKDAGASPARIKAFDPEIYQAYMDAYVRQGTPSVRYDRGVAFTAARRYLEGVGPRMRTHQRMWWLPREIATQTGVTLEDAYYASFGAIVYLKLLAQAKNHVRGTEAALEDIRWTESA